MGRCRAPFSAVGASGGRVVHRRYAGPSAAALASVGDRRPFGDRRAARRAPSVRELLAAAVAGIGGIERPGQVQMAEAVATAMADGGHLLVQAGTGTGKSLAYLVPALLHGEPVVVATATLALQNQVVDRDLPALVDAVEPLLGPAADVRDPQGPVQLPVPEQGARRHAGRRRRGAVRPVADHRARPRGRAAARLGRRDRDRRPRRARPGRLRPGLAAGQRHRPGVPGRGQVPATAPSASPSWPASGPPRSTSW